MIPSTPVNRQPGSISYPVLYASMRRLALFPYTVEKNDGEKSSHDRVCVHASRFLCLRYHALVLSATAFLTSCSFVPISSILQPSSLIASLATHLINSPRFLVSFGSFPTSCRYST